MRPAGGTAHLALGEMLGLNNVVKQLPSSAQFHHNVYVVLVLMSALYYHDRQAGRQAGRQHDFLAAAPELSCRPIIKT